MLLLRFPIGFLGLEQRQGVVVADDPAKVVAEQRRFFGQQLLADDHPPFDVTRLPQSVQGARAALRTRQGAVVALLSVKLIIDHNDLKPPCQTIQQPNQRYSNVLFHVLLVIIIMYFLKCISIAQLIGGNASLVVSVRVSPGFFRRRIRL